MSEEEAAKSPFFKLERAKELSLPPQSVELLAASAAAAGIEAEAEAGADKGRLSRIGRRAEAVYDRLNESYSGESQGSAEDAADAQDDAPPSEGWHPSKEFLDKLVDFHEEFWEEVAATSPGPGSRELGRDLELFRGWKKHRDKSSAEMAGWFEQADTAREGWLDPEGYQRYRSIEAEVMEDRHGSWIVLDKPEDGKEGEGEAAKDKAGGGAGEEEDPFARKLGKNFMKVFNWIKELSGGEGAKGVTLDGLRKWKIAFYSVETHVEEKGILERKAFKDMFWRHVRRWAEGAVEYRTLDLPWYTLTEDDL